MLKAMKPEDRRLALEQVKLSPALLAQLTEYRKLKPEARKPKEVIVQIWLDKLPADGLETLKAVGFTFGATLTPNRLVVGTITLDGLDALLEQSFVRRVELPKFK